MKKEILSLLLFMFVTALFAQQSVQIGPYERTGEVVMSEIEPTKDPMAFLTNVRKHPKAQKEITTKNTKTTELDQQYTGNAPIPVLEQTLTPGPNHDGGYPYDNGISVSNQGQVVTATNLGVYVYDLDGDIAMSTGYHSFLGTIGGKFDPQIAYDDENDRYIVVILRTGTNVNCGVDIAVSASSDPTGTWYSYFIPNTHDHPSSWVDFPHMGISSDRLYVHANIYNDSYFLESNIWDVPLSELYAGSTINPVKHITDDSNIRFLVDGDGVYGPKYYGINIGISNAIKIYTFENGTMDEGVDIATLTREASGEFYSQDKLLYPGGDASNSYSYMKDSILFYTHGGTYYYTDKDDTTTLIYGSIILDFDDLSESVANTPHFVIDQARNYCYAHISYAGYSDEEGRPASILTALYGSETEYLGTIAYHIAPNEEISDGLIVAEGTGQVDTRMGDYIQTVPNPSGTREVWITGQFGSNVETNAIENTGNADGLYLGNIIAKISVEEDDGVVGIYNKPQTFHEVKKAKLYPNPAYEFVSYEFEVEKDGIYKAKIYSVEGKYVKTITDRRVKKGTVKLSFNANAYEKGTYYIILEDANGNKVSSNKLVVN